MIYVKNKIIKWIYVISILCFSLLRYETLSGKYSRNHNRNTILRNQFRKEIKKIKNKDSTILLLMICSGCRSDNNSFYKFDLHQRKVCISRISTYGKYKPITIETNAPIWKELYLNLDKIIIEELKNFKPINDTLFQGPSSHGEIQTLYLHVDKRERQFNLWPLVDSYNETTETVKLIKALKEVLNQIIWENE